MGQFAQAWSFEFPAIAVLPTLTVCYLLAARLVSERHPQQRWPARFTGNFLAGIGLVTVVTLGPLGSYDGVFFWAHMAQHIVLMMLAAPLLLRGQPVLLVLRVSSVGFRRGVVVPTLRSRPMRVLTHPVASWLVFAGVLVGSHVTGFFEFALEHPAVHQYVEHPLYLGSGLSCFYPMLGIGPASKRMRPTGTVLYVSMMMAVEVAVGLWIAGARLVLYPYYLAVPHQPWGPATALADQRIGGILMWSAGVTLNGTWISIALREQFRTITRHPHTAPAGFAAIGGTTRIVP